MAFPIVRFTNNDVSVFITSTSLTQIDLTNPTLPAGEYLVTVTTAQGVSNSVPFTIIEDIDPEDGFTKILDHVAQAHNRLLHQYKRPHLDAAQYADSTQVGKLLQALYTTGIQGLEDAANSTIAKLLIDSVSGKNLDQIGTIVGQPRNNLGDVLYRTYLHGKIAVNSSNGTSEDLYKVWKAFTGISTGVDMVEVFPAGVLIFTDTSPPIAYINVIKDYLDRALGVAISLVDIILYDPTNAFTFSSTSSVIVDPLLGFGDFNNPGVTGGKLASVL